MDQPRQSSLKNIITRNLPGINVVQLSVVEDENADQYKSRFFAFLKGVPGEQSQDSPTGRTYNYKNAINLKLEVEKMFAMANALRICGQGQYEAYEKNFGMFEIFADGSRSSYGGGSKKNLKVGVMKNDKTGKFVITISFFSDGRNISGYLSPYDALAFAKVLEFCGEKILDLESSKNTGIVVPNQQTKSFTPNAGQRQPQQPAPQQPAPQQNSETTDTSNAEEGFRSMFTPMGGGGMDGAPF